MKQKDWDAVDKLVKENQHLRQGLDDEVNKHRRNNVEQLEEIRQLMQENEKLKENIKQIHKDYGCEVRDPYGTIWQQCERIQKENKKLKKAILKLNYMDDIDRLKAMVEGE